MFLAPIYFPAETTVTKQRGIKFSLQTATKANRRIQDLFQDHSFLEALVILSVLLMI
jgi:hypothetical protein